MLLPYPDCCEYISVNMGVQISLWDVGAISSLKYYTYLEVGLLDHMTVLFLVFWGTFTLFSTVAMPIHIPTSGAQGFTFLHILTCIFFLFIHNSHLYRCELIIWWSLWFWFPFPWWLVMFRTLSYTYWQFVCLHWRNVYLISFPIFNQVIRFFFFYYWVVDIMNFGY